MFAALPPPPGRLDQPVDVLVAGIGGSGVVTVGALLGMAAHLEGKGCSVLDVTGLAQKNGPVTSHVRIADDPSLLHATRIAAGAADLVLGCDVVVTSGAEVLSRMSPGRTRAVVDTHVAPTSAFATHPDLDLSPDAMARAIREAAGKEGGCFLPATELVTALLGDGLATNLFLVGCALQRGWLPLGLGALERAIELNGRAVEMNKRALAWGRLAAHDLDAVRRAAAPGREAAGSEAGSKDLAGRVARRVELLTAYQNAAYARRYSERVERVAAREQELCGGERRLTEAVAHYYFKLLAYKDEYEVARLYTDGEFRRQLESEFEGSYRLQLHLAPQFLNRRDPATGRARKWTFGPWVFPALRVLARLKFLRGTPVDPFGWTAHRRVERQVVRDYEATVEELLAGLSPENHPLAVEIARLPEHIRGFDLVKERHWREVREKEAELLAAFRLRDPAAAVRRLG